MYFKELAAIFGVSTQTLRKMIKTSPEESIRKLGNKKGTGTFFYDKDEISLLFEVFLK